MRRLGNKNISLSAYKAKLSKEVQSTTETKNNHVDDFGKVSRYF